VCSGDPEELEKQVVEIGVPIVGTPFNLEYQNDCVPGRAAERRLQIQVTGDTVGPGIDHILVETQIAGRVFLDTVAAEPNQIYELIWDGVDAYGRLLQGEQPARVRVGNVYVPESITYMEPVDFGFAGLVPVGSGGTRTGLVLWQRFAPVQLAYCDGRPQGLGGWDLDVHRRRFKDDLAETINTVLDTRTYQGLGLVRGIVSDSEGTIYAALSSPQNAHVVSLSRSGVLDVVVNVSGVRGFSGDGGDAKDAKLNGPAHVALGPDGSLYIADTTNFRVRRVWPADESGVRIITTFAGNGVDASAGDGGLATEASLRSPQGVATGADGSVYISEFLVPGGRVRRVNPCGIIETVAGGGSGDVSDGGPAINVRLDGPRGIDIGPEGDLYIAQWWGHRLLKVAPDGILSTVAGLFPSGGYNGDGIPASEAKLSFPNDVTVAPDGTIYISDGTNRRIRRIGGDGIITTIAGTGLVVVNSSGDGGLALHADLSSPYAVTIVPSGDVYVSDDSWRIREIRMPLPHFEGGEFYRAALDGQTVDIYSQLGRHLRTVDALTGALIYEFGYDDDGKIVSVTDASNNVTTIEHDTSGNPTAIVGPFGQRTELTVDAGGYLATVENPAGDTYSFTYDTGGLGLMQTMADPETHLYTYEYDSLGRLTESNDPAGGQVTYVRTEPDIDSFTVSATTALGRTTAIDSERFADSGQQQVTTYPDGTELDVTTAADLSCTTITTEGTLVEIEAEIDPRFKTQSPLAAETTITTPDPNGPVVTMTNTRDATLADPANPFSLLQLVDTQTVAGNIITRSDWGDAVTILTIHLKALVK
jgi:YD repeat-containing protein